MSVLISHSPTIPWICGKWLLLPRGRSLLVNVSIMRAQLACSCHWSSSDSENRLCVTYTDWLSFLVCHANPCVGSMRTIHPNLEITSQLVMWQQSLGLMNLPLNVLYERLILVQKVGIVQQAECLKFSPHSRNSSP